jgi:hypothetical protein
MPIKTAGGDRHAIIFKLLGPSSVKVTSDVYAHVIGSASRDADERAAALTSLFHEGIEMTGGTVAAGLVAAERVWGCAVSPRGAAVWVSEGPGRGRSVVEAAG